MVKNRYLLFQVNSNSWQDSGKEGGMMLGLLDH